jgi:hypothetical protein
MSKVGARILILAASGLLALASPSDVAARGGHGGGGGGGGGGAGHIGSGGAPHSGAHFAAPAISRGATFTRSFAHGPAFTRSFTRTGIAHAGPGFTRFNHISHVSRVNRASFAAHALPGHARIFAPAAARGAFLAHNARWGSRADWWRHRRGFFFGWAGPLFWPYFYDDLWYGVFWDWGPEFYDDPFWAYGYGDIYGAMFSPYGYGDLAGWAPPLRTGSIARNAPRQPAPQPTQWSAMCGTDTQVVDLPIDRISAAVAPTADQRAALDALGNASVQAAQLIKSACPSDVAYTPTGRLDAMEHRVQAMVQAVALIRPPLDNFYGALSDEQKARLNALGFGDAARARATTRTCGPNAAALPTWPQAQIESRLHPSPGQQTLLDRLKDASAKAADMIKAACPGEPPASPPARLAAVARRLDALLDAVKLVHAALNDFYGSLTDEQKAQFNGIAPIVQNTPTNR